MTTTGAVNTVLSSNSTNVSTGTSRAMGKYDFLRILATELQYQDPSNPADTKDTIAQLAQFSSLEQMQNLTDAFKTLGDTLQDFIENQINSNISIQIMESGGLIGKNITGQVDGKDIEGKVSSIVITDDVAYAVIGESKVPVNSISKVF
jgi:flagellar basal-body rod modification protein FlgD